MSEHRPIPVMASKLRHSGESRNPDARPDHRPVLITGARGQLGGELVRLIREDARALPCLAVDCDDFDITRPEEVRAYCQAARPGAIINCAAYTAVDDAETDPDTAFAVNARGPANLAKAAAQFDVPMVHISTDFVFDGAMSRPYRESDTPNPLNVYGKSKLAGERAVFTSNPKSLVIRTGWLYSSRGKNFVRTIIGAARGAARQNSRLRVVSDQVGTPTHAADLAMAILEILPSVEKGYGQVFHFSNEGVASWYDFAVAAINFSGLPCIVEPIETSGYPTPAIRPAYSVLNKEKIKRVFGLSISHWAVPLAECIETIERELA